MATSTDPQDATSAAGAEKLGFDREMVVQEFGYDDDVTDGVVVWYRDGEDDLTDLLVDVQTVLDDGGAIWVFTPKPGRDGHVGHNDIQEAASTAGLHVTSTFSIARDWSATKLGTRGRGR